MVVGADILSREPDHQPAKLRRRRRRRLWRAPRCQSMEALVGNTIARILTDKGYRGHNAPPDYKFRVFISGQKRGVTPQIKRELRRRSAVEPVIGHLKAEHRMDRNYLWYRRGDAANAVLAAVGYNFRRLIRWLRILLRLILSALLAEPLIKPA
jgi:transposase, IS5 family